MRLPVSLIAAALLAGCATTRPEPVIRTVEVRVPVPVACVDRVPDLPAPLPSPPPKDVREALNVALAALLDWRAYGTEADGKLRACAAVGG